MENELIEQAYQAARKVLYRCICPAGFKASAAADGYREIWTRDSCMTTIAIAKLADPVLLTAAENCLRTIARHQTDSGLLPNNVDSVSDEANYQASLDGTMWFSIALVALVQATSKIDFGQSLYQTTVRAQRWLAAQDVDDSGLISVQEASDWQDLFPTRGKALYDNVLYYQSLMSQAWLAEKYETAAVAEKYRASAQTVAKKIYDFFWVFDSKRTHTDNMAKAATDIHNSVSLEAIHLKLAENSSLSDHSYLLAWRSFMQTGTWFDTLGNMLAIYFGLTNRVQNDLILQFMRDHHIAEPYPAKAIDPPILPSDVNWRDYLTKRNLNMPHHYHNGGIWPFIGGWYILALLKTNDVSGAKQALEQLAKLNQRGLSATFEFNEWFDGQTAEPLGKPYQAWSAALYCLAYLAVREASLVI